MRRVRIAAAVFLAALAAVAPAPAAAASAETVEAGAKRLEPWRPALREARRFADGRLGSVSFALRTRRRVYALRPHVVVPAASVVKAMLLVAYLDHPTVRRRPLRDRDRDLLAPMIRWSDNVAATRVRDYVGNGALERLARRAGMRNFAADPIWGFTQITAADQTRLFMRIDRYVVRRHRDYAMRLLRTVVPTQRWGIGRVRPRSWALYMKSGWGSGSGRVDHQVALLRRGRRWLALAILTTGSPSHAYATATLRGVARRLLRGLGPRSVPR
jgi:beta-lactamase class A